MSNDIASRIAAEDAAKRQERARGHHEAIETERKRAIAIIHWVFSADGTKSERSLADEAIDKINDPTFMTTDA